MPVPLLAWRAVFGRFAAVTYVRRLCRQGPVPERHLLKSNATEILIISARARQRRAPRLVEKHSIHSGGRGGRRTFAEKSGQRRSWGNTQDISCRAAKNAGIQCSRQNGTVATSQSTARANPGISIGLFFIQKWRHVDAVWTVEPLVTRLELRSESEDLFLEDNTTNYHHRWLEREVPEWPIATPGEEDRGGPRGFDVLDPMVNPDGGSKSVER